MLGWIQGWVMGLIVLGVAAVVFFGTTGFLAWTSISNILQIRKLSRHVESLPPEALLTSNGGAVTVSAYEKASGEKKDFLVYKGSPTWKGGERSASQVSKMVKRQLFIRIAAFTLVVIPLSLSLTYFLVVGLLPCCRPEAWVGRSLLLGFLLGVIVAEQYIPFVFGPGADNMFPEF